MNEAVLVCKEVTRFFEETTSKKLHILTNIDLVIHRAEQIAIIGRSGSGKTTLLQMLGGLDKPNSGQVLLNGRDYQSLSEQDCNKIRNESLGFIYQSHHLLPEFSALENVMMPLLIAKKDIKQSEIKAKELLDSVGLNKRFSHRPNMLSGGECQRVAIARALINQPDCVLADEPTGNLDDENSAHVFEVMCQLNQQLKTTFVLVTHDREMANQTEKVYQLKEGQLNLL